MSRTAATTPRSTPRGTAGARERERRAEALRHHRANDRARQMASAGELASLRVQLRLAARLMARLALTNDIDEMVQLLVDELHETFAFYLVAIQRLDADATLRLVAGSGALAEVMTEFLLVEQSLHEGVNGRVARSGTSALVADTRLDPDYIQRDASTDPRSELSAPILVDGRVWGVLNIEAPDSDAFSEADAVLVEAIAASLGSSIHRARLVADLQQTFTTTLTALMSTVEAKDDYTASHEQHVAELTRHVALRLGMDATSANDAYYAALLHDVGKVAVPSEILLKPGPLDEDEWVVMRGHAAAGGKLVAAIPGFAHLAPAVRASHERWDGGGYPDGLSGERIPLAARIIAACDTYDAIVTDRPYRPARTSAEAAEELRRIADSQLDPRVVDALLAEISAHSPPRP
ncbi:MAG TPA: HD domain-containing phosphohydrolase [Solirubrobacteraceae bacterium]|nr:HD domain-containing phosphohydrolase [Solirubrobacteraceae bacterium]